MDIKLCKYINFSYYILVHLWNSLYI